MSPVAVQGWAEGREPCRAKGYSRGGWGFAGALPELLLGPGHWPAEVVLPSLFTCCAVVLTKDVGFDKLVSVLLICHRSPFINLR